MSLSSHLEELKRKHQSLSEAVEAAQRAPSVDDARITDLKKKKTAPEGRDFASLHDLTHVRRCLRISFGMAARISCHSGATGDQDRRKHQCCAGLCDARDDQCDG